MRRTKNVREIKIEDIIGKFISPLIAGSKRFIDAKWIPARIILSNKNIWLIGKDIKKRIPLESIYDMGGRIDINPEITRTPYYLLIRHIDRENQISLISAKKDDLDRLRSAITEVLLNGRVVVIKYPVKKGGVVQRDAKWVKAQIAIKENGLRLVTKEGKLIKIELDKLQKVKKEESEFEGKLRKIVDIQFSEPEGEIEFTVECYIHASEKILNVLYQFIYSGFDRVSADLQLSDTEKQIIMSLYTGISPFEIPSFLGLDVDEVEDIYENLIKLGVLKEVRKRKEVILTTRGKNLASEALSQ